MASPVLRTWECAFRWKRWTELCARPSTRVLDHECKSPQVSKRPGAAAIGCASFTDRPIRQPRTQLLNIAFGQTKCPCPWQHRGRHITQPGPPAINARSGIDNGWSRCAAGHHNGDLTPPVIAPVHAFIFVQHMKMLRSAAPQYAMHDTVIAWQYGC